MRASKNIIILFLVLLLSQSLHAVKVRKISLSNYKEMQKGRLDGTLISSRGELILGPTIKKIPGPESEFFLSLAIDKNNNKFIGTGHKGTLYKIDQSNKITKLFSAKELDIYATLARKNGNILVGTSPGGKIYTIDKKGKSKLFFNPGEKFIWDIKEHHDGNIYCAVGNSGGVYRIDKLGNGKKMFSSEDPHIMKLFISKNGSIYAGSGNKGILYKITNRKTKVMFDSRLQEIRGICEDPFGNIYFSANRDVNENISIKKNKNIIIMKSIVLNKIPVKKKSILYKLDTSGIVSQVWSSIDENIYSIYYDKKRKSVIIGTGNSGRVYSVKEDKSFSLLYESESSQAFKIVKGNNGFFLLSNNTASLIKIEDKLNNIGSYFSKVIDLKYPSKLGRAYWKLKTSNDSRVLVYLRAGNSLSPDKTWLKWTAPYSDNKGTNIDISGYRYVQIKIVLNTSNPNYSPVFNSFSLYSLPANIEPKIEEIKISPKGRNTIIKLKTNDPNKDKIQFNLYLKKTDKKKWILFKKNVIKNIISLKNELFEDGEYRLKVVANDALQNPVFLAKSTVKISEFFILDTTAPKLLNFISKNNNITFEIKDNVSIISNVLYSYDGLKDWNPIFPEDMVSDSNSERYVFKLKNTKDRIVFLKVVDEFKNYKVYQKEY